LTPRLTGLSILEARVGRCGLVTLELSKPGVRGGATVGVAGVAGGEVILVLLVVSTKSLWVDYELI